MVISRHWRQELCLQATVLESDTAGCNMDVIYPLAVPKGRRLYCEVCEAPAERVCTACTVTYYW